MEAEQLHRVLPPVRLGGDTARLFAAYPLSKDLVTDLRGRNQDSVKVTMDIDAPYAGARAYASKAPL